VEKNDQWQQESLYPSMTITINPNTTCSSENQELAFRSALAALSPMNVAFLKADL